MFNKIKLYLLKKGILKPKTVIDKMEIILNSEIKINKLYTIEICGVMDIIVSYKNELKRIIDFDLLNKEIYIDTNIEKHIESKKIIHWISTDKRVPSDPVGAIKDFILTAKDYYNIYHMYKDTNNGAILSYNVRILQIHIIYIENLINKIFKIL